MPMHWPHDLGELSGQLDSIELEVRSGIEQEINKINTLTRQLATVNRQLEEKISIDKQPPQLLDQRDTILLAIWRR